MINIQRLFQAPTPPPNESLGGQQTQSQSEISRFFASDSLDKSVAVVHSAFSITLQRIPSIEDSLNLAYLEIEKKNYAEAEKLLLKSAQQNSFNQESSNISFIQNFISFLKNGQWDSAIAQAICLPALCTTNLSIYNKIVKIYISTLVHIAEQNNADAINLLGTYYLNGQYAQYGMEKDDKKAFAYFEKSAGLGYPFAQYHLGVCYQFGIGTTQDYNKAIEQFTKALQQGFLYSQQNINTIAGDFNNFGLNYFYGKDGIEKNEKIAFKFFEWSACLGHADAQNNLADYYFYGEGGVETDYKKAFQLYKSACIGYHGIGERLSNLREFPVC